MKKINNISKSRKEEKRSMTQSNQSMSQSNKLRTKVKNRKKEERRNIKK